ncbi:acyl-CoA desaturase [bacterium]|nr:acyl-CoA desaturase [bacterium]
MRKSTRRIGLFFLLHWYFSGFMQTFFLHRYASHRIFTMSKFWERMFYLLTFLTQGSSFLNPRAYAIMHRMHHAHSDTEKDPHSPVQHGNVFKMMWHTYKVYSDIVNRRTNLGGEFDTNLPEWKEFDRAVSGIPMRLVFVGFYTLFYLRFARSPWQFLLLPVHIVMGPVHGAIVNWFGHRVGYRNSDDIHDNSRNTLPFDFLTQGELFQNNHHRYPGRPNLAIKWFEFDPTYPWILFLDRIGIIKLREKAKEKRHEIPQKYEAISI